MLNDNVIKATIAALERQERTLLEAATPKARQMGNNHLADGIVATQQALGLMRALQKGDAIASLWWVDDVYSLTEDDEGNHNPKITETEARAVLKAADDNHNAEYGINWDVLREHLDMVLEARGEDPNGGDGQDD